MVFVSQGITGSTKGCKAPQSACLQSNAIEPSGMYICMYGGEAGGLAYVAICNYYGRYMYVVVGPDML